MSEDVINEYKIIFEIRLLYHYWVKYLEDYHILSASELKKRISSYDSRSFFAIQPSKKTEKKLEQLGWIYKETSLGCIVAASEGLLNLSSFKNVELKFLLNPLAGDLAEYSGSFPPRDEDEDEENKRYKKILWFSNKQDHEQNNIVIENPEEQEHRYIFRKKSTLGNFAADPQKEKTYAVSVRPKEDKIYHRNILLDEDLPADTFALVQLTISMESDQEAEQFGHFFEINFERYNRKEKKAVHSNDENKEPDTGDGLLQMVRSIIPGL